MTAVIEPNFHSYAQNVTSRGANPVNWMLGVFIALGIHAAGFALALSSGAGMSLQPEGGGGTGGMTVMMGSGTDGRDNETHVAQRVEAVTQPVAEPEIVPPKPVVKPIPKPKPKVKPKPVKRTKPKKAKPVKVVQQKVVEHSAQPSVSTAIQGAVHGKGSINTVAGGGHVGASVGAGTSKGFGIDTAMKAYRRQIHKLLLNAKRYPKTAQRLGQQGSVRVKFVIRPDGKAMDVVLLESCRYPSLNREAKALIKRVGTFPPLPKEIAKGPVSFRFNIPFKLY